MSEQLKEAVQAIDRAHAASAEMEPGGAQVGAILGNVVVALERLAEAVQELEKEAGS